MSGTEWKIQFEEMIKFIETFIGKLQPTKSIESSNSTVPAPLDLFYKLTETRINDIITYNNFISMKELDYDKQYLIFYVQENETCYWSTFFNKDESRVIKIDEYNNMIFEENDLTNFLFQMCIYEICQRLKYNLMYFAKPDEVNEILDAWNRFPFKVRKSKDDFPNEFYYKEEAIGFVWHGEKGYTFYCGAESIGSLKFMKTFIDKKGLKNDAIHVDMNERLEEGYWEFYINGDSCKENEFWF